MSITYELPMYSRLEPRTTWTGSRITDIDPLTLDEAAKFATKHAGTEITVNDFLRAAARGEITLRAIVHRRAKLQKFDGGIYCNKGTPTENIMPKGCIATLPVSACRQLANTGHASWRTIDGFEMIDGERRRYEIARLTEDEPDIETNLNDCRVIGYDVHALADEYIDAPAEASKQALRVNAKPTQQAASKFITKSQAVTAFGGLVEIDLAGAMEEGKQWILDARVSKGARGRYQSMWNPVLLAIALREHKMVPKPKLNQAFFTHDFLSDWREEWHEHSKELP